MSPTSRGRRTKSGKRIKPIGTRTAPPIPGWGLDGLGAPSDGFTVAAAAATFQVPRRTPYGSPTILSVRATIIGSEPEIWRRLDIASRLTLDTVHTVLQVAFGWNDSHLHQFVAGDVRGDAEYFLPGDGMENCDGTVETSTRLDELLGEEGDELGYEYDFGDSWWHSVVLESTRPQSNGGGPVAVCTAGERRGPVEDSGGIGGYWHLLHTISDPKDPEYLDSREWLGLEPNDVFDAEHFDTAAVNGVLARLP